MRVTGAQALLRSLEHEGVDVIFGLPGGVVLPIYDAFVDSPIRHVLVRHEQGAGHMAEGYALATGRAGVALVTSGPGATNIITAVADAYVDAVPLVVITGQVSSTSLGSDAFQEADTTGITMPITKHSWLVTDAREIPSIVHEAFHIATTGRPGPVLIDFPKDVANDAMDWYVATGIDLPGYPSPASDNSGSVAAAAIALISAARPVLWSGRPMADGTLHASLVELAELAGAEVVTTATSEGGEPLRQADLIVVIGAAHDEEIDGASLAATVVRVGAVDDLLAAVRTIMCIQGAGAGRPESHATAHEPEDARSVRNRPDPDGPLFTGDVIQTLRGVVPEDTIVVSGAGPHEAALERSWRSRGSPTLLGSQRFGTMGFAVPAAIGAKVGRPHATVWAIDDDACFQMTGKELVTANVEGIPIKVAVLTDAHRRSRWPDHVKAAQAMGCVGLQASTPREAGLAIDLAHGIDDRAVVVDFHVDNGPNI